MVEEIDTGTEVDAEGRLLQLELVGQVFLCGGKVHDVKVGVAHVEAELRTSCHVDASQATQPDVVAQVDGHDDLLLLHSLFAIARTQVGLTLVVEDGTVEAQACQREFHGGTDVPAVLVVLDVVGNRVGRRRLVNLHVGDVVTTLDTELDTLCLRRRSYCHGDKHEHCCKNFLHNLQILKS